VADYGVCMRFYDKHAPWFWVFGSMIALTVYGLILCH